MSDTVDSLRAEVARLKAELENRSNEPDMTASDAYWHCVDLIEPHVKEQSHGGSECSEESLCRSVCDSLQFLIGHWENTK